jgi:hypothetical protein
MCFSPSTYMTGALAAYKLALAEERITELKGLSLNC